MVNFKSLKKMQKSELIKIPMTILFIGLILLSCTNSQDQHVGQTTVSKWQGNKKSAVSITYDDGIITQFTVARPIMNQLNLPATFFVLTGKLNGSEEGRFLGRSKDDIIRETEATKTNADNFFERASLIGYTGPNQGILAHSSAGSLYESGKITAAYASIDEAYKKLRNGIAPVSISMSVCFFHKDLTLLL